jgi:hypothetical protein
MKKETGGSAFPAQEMTLRDYFAGQAAMGLINRIVDVGMEDPRIDIAEKHQKNIAITAYMVADAMIKERDK